MKKHEKYNTVKQFACLLLACLLLLPAAAFAEGGGEVAGQLPLAAEPDSGIIDSDALNSWMDGFLKEHDITGNWQDFSVGFCYTGTGDCWYYDADVWMYSASLYKVPVSMLMAEKEAAGELTPESIVMGCTLEYLESTALVYSNNDSGHAMVSFLGGTYNGKCSDMTEKFTDLPAEYFSQDFLDVSYYTARYMTQVMKTLYTGGDAAYPHVIPYLEQAQPNEYFNLNPTLKSYGVAQKYGAFEETYAGKNNNHCAAIRRVPGTHCRGGRLSGRLRPRPGRKGEGGCRRARPGTACCGGTGNSSRCSGRTGCAGAACRSDRRGRSSRRRSRDRL